MHTTLLHHYHQDGPLRRVQDTRAGERRTRWVVALAAVTMVVEILCGWLFNSLALLADGWHMASHVGALGITLLAYAFARRHATNERFTFGTGKVGVLGAYTSAIVLGLVALLMVWESVDRLVTPQAIAFDQAILVAILGLVVNLASAALLHDTAAAGHHPHQGHDHDHHDHHHHDHSHHHGDDARLRATSSATTRAPGAGGGDHAVRAAYLHVLADALTSVLAIAALLAGRAFGWTWADAAMGLVGAVIIGRWAVALARDTGALLLDSAVPPDRAEAIRARIEADADNRIADLHLWSVGSSGLAAIVSVVTHHPRPPTHYKALLADQADLLHVTVEVHGVPGASCLVPAITSPPGPPPAPPSDTAPRPGA